MSSKMTEREEKLVRDVVRRLEAMRLERQRHEDIWEDIAEHVLPRVADITIDSSVAEATRLATNYDSTGRNALRLWANGIQGYMTPRNAPWVKVTVPNAQLRDQGGVRKYLQGVTEALLDALRASNFYDALGPTYEHGAALGTATMTIDWDEEARRLVYLPRHPKQVYIAENFLGRVDTVYTVEELSWKQVIEAFGEEPFDEPDLETAKRDPYKYVEVLHAVFPREDRMEGKVDAKNKKYASVWVFLGRDLLLREGGYDQLRDIVWRYRVGPGSPYGTSPSHDALIDVLRAEKISETMLRAADLAVRPPMLYPAELEGRLRLNPHGMTPYFDARRKIEPAFLTGNYPYGLDREQAIQEAIRQHYHIDFWLMLSQSEGTKTAYEVSQLAGEKAAVMGSEVGRIESELLDPALNVSVWLLGENGLLPEPPRGLREKLQAASFSYDGPLAQLQKRHYGQQNIIQMLSQVTLIMQVHPEAADWINFDELMKQALTSLDAPEDLIQEERVVKQVRQMRQQIQAQQLKIGMAQQAAEVQATLAKAGATPGGAPMGAR